MVSAIEKIAAWAHGLRPEDIPADVVDLCRHQTASVLAACFAADVLPASKILRGALSKLGAGDTKSAPFGDTADMATACAITAGLSVALDFDDYLFLGHTGHSAVSAPLVLGAYLGVSAGEALVAQAIANEIAGRLGASVVLGPHNGQLWVFIHAAAAALAASRLFGLDPARTAHALALSLSAPPYPSFSSIMGPDSKMFIVAEPVAAGVRAASLARDGFTGPLDMLDDPQGLYAGLAFTPLRFFLEGLGKSWVTHTIAFKPYPGCAYVDAVADSLLDILAAFKTERGRALAPDDVSRIDIKSTLLTTQMESLGKSFERPGEMPPAHNLNFRVPHTAAILLLAGRLTSAEFAPAFLAQNSAVILSLASKVRLTHDWDMTLAVLRAFSAGLAPMSVISKIPLSGILRARREARRRISHELPFDLASIVDLFRRLRREDFARLRRAFADKTSGMVDVDFCKLRLPFAARVRLVATDGKSYESGREIPDGAPGGKNHPDAARAKFLQEAAPHIGADRTEETLAKILAGSSPKEIVKLLSS